MVKYHYAYNVSDLSIPPKIFEVQNYLKACLLGAAPQAVRLRRYAIILSRSGHAMQSSPYLLHPLPGAFLWLLALRWLALHLHFALALISALALIRLFASPFNLLKNRSALAANKIRTWSAWKVIAPFSSSPLTTSSTAPSTKAGSLPLKSLNLADERILVVNSFTNVSLVGSV